MYKDSLFQTTESIDDKFTITEFRLLRNVLYEANSYPFCQIFHTELSDSGSKNRKLERNVRLRSFILFQHANPVYKQNYDRDTLVSAYRKLKMKYEILLNSVQSFSDKILLQHVENNLPEFLLSDKENHFDKSLILSNLYKDHELLFQSENLKRQKIPLLRSFLFGLKVPAVFLIRKYRHRKGLIRDLTKNESFNSLWKTINHVSFPLNNLVFEKGITEAIKGKTELVDIAAFLMLIGDEFIDQLAFRNGEEVNKVIKQMPAGWLQLNINVDFTLDASRLIYAFRQLNSNPAMLYEKYGITTEKFFIVLTDVLSEINRRILQLSTTKRMAVSTAVSSFLNYCLSTFQDDLYFTSSYCPQNLTVQNTNWYFFKKNNLVMILGLWLRAIILNREPEKYSAQFNEWGYLVANLQLYDDLIDMPSDLHIQPNLPLLLSKDHFPEEYQWFINHKEDLNRFSGNEQIALISFEMPKTVAHTLMLSRIHAVKHLNWFTSFASEYNWYKNWFGVFLAKKDKKRKSQTVLDVFCIENEYKTCSGYDAVQVATKVAKKVLPLSKIVPNNIFFDYVALLCLYDDSFRKEFFSFHGNIAMIPGITTRQFMQPGSATQLLDEFLRSKKFDLRNLLDTPDL